MNQNQMDRLQLLDLFDNDSKDDESTISSTSRDDLDLSFDPSCLCLQERAAPSSDPRVNVGYGGIARLLGFGILRQRLPSNCTGTCPCYRRLPSVSEHES